MRLLAVHAQPNPRHRLTPRQRNRRVAFLTVFQTWALAQLWSANATRVERLEAARPTTAIEVAAAASAPDSAVRLAALAGVKVP